MSIFDKSEIVKHVYQIYRIFFLFLEIFLFLEKYLSHVFEQLIIENIRFTHQRG